MKNVLLKLKKIYGRSVIFQFLISYILILVLSLMIMGYGFGSAFKIVKDDTEKSYVTMFQHSADVIDNEMEMMQSLALRISKADSVSRFADYETREKDYVATALKTIDYVAQTMNFQKIELIDNVYIYFRGMNLVLYGGSFYRPEVMRRYLEEWEIPEDEWHQTTLNPDNRVPGYQKSGNKLEYVFPFSNQIDGKNASRITIIH